MRLLHTSDWHVGRTIQGNERLDEMERVFDQLVTFAREERVDAILVSGDVFDRRRPPAECERMVNRFLRRVAEAGAWTIAIAGNHDDPHLTDARGILAELANAHFVGVPRSAEQGGVTEVAGRSGDRAVIACLPFASPGQWVPALMMAEDEAIARLRYADTFRAAVALLSRSFRRDAVNVLMAHTHLEGALLSESEKPVHVTETWAATPQALPADATYIALGHIHKPQRLSGLLHAYYAGSPLQLDFGEVGQSKSFMFVDAAPGLPPRVEPIPYEGTIPLVDLPPMTPAAIEARSEELAKLGWLRATVIAEPDPDLNRKVRAMVPNIVKVVLPERERDALELRAPRGATPREIYRTYLASAGEDAGGELLDAFDALYERAMGEPCDR
jgi:exonuclease SbcD